VTVDLTTAKGELALEWFDPATGRTAKRGATTGGGRRKLTAPFKGSAVLYVHRARK
jgi:hypothetical protein